MEKQKIEALTQEIHARLFDWLNQQPQDHWEMGPEGKWTVGQQVLHLVESSNAILKGLSYPKFILKYKFGTCNRPTRSYDTVVARYHERLEEVKGIEIAFNRDMKTPTVAERDDLIDQLKKNEHKLIRKIQRLSDKNLDTLLLPHPLMGRMTLRELLMWSAFHTEHHLQQLEKNYQF